MNTTIKVAIAAGAITLAALSVYGCFGLTRHVIIAVDRWGDAAPDLKPTLANFNRPCGIRNVKSSANYSTFYSEGSLMPCGTLAEISTSVVKAGDAVVQTQLVERATAPHITAAMDTLNDSARKLGWTADSLSGTATALTGTAQGATDMLAEGKRTIAAAQPLLDAYTQSGDDLDVLLKRKSITDILDNVAGMTVHANSISGEFDLVTQKAAGDYLSPQPWWRKIGRFAGDTYDYGALFARHTP